jgi:hypothetical protein
MHACVYLKMHVRVCTNRVKQSLETAQGGFYIFRCLLPSSTTVPALDKLPRIIRESLLRLIPDEDRAHETPANQLSWTPEGSVILVLCPCHLYDTHVNFE